MGKTRLAPLGWKKGPFLAVRPASKRKKSKKSCKYRPGGIKPKKPQEQGGYQGRHLAVEAAGFATYREYLESDLWRSIRRQVFVRDGHKCRACQKPATEVHHQTYSEAAIRGTDLLPLWSLCRECHEHIEFDGGKKLKRMGAVQHRLNALIALHRRNRT